MYVYILNFLLNMLVGFLIFYFRKTNNSKKYNNSKKIYLIFTTIQLSLIAGFRSIRVGWDTGTYKTIFDLMSDSINYIFVKQNIVEIGFSALCSGIKILGGDFQALLILTSTFVVGSCNIFIYRHSKNVLLSVFLIWCFPFYYTSFDIIRHSIVVGFFLLGYKHIEKSNFIRYCIYILIGSLFHTVAFLFIPFYFVKKIKWKWSTIFSGVAITIFAFLLINNIATFLFDLINKGNQIESGWIGAYSGGEKTCIMYAILFFIALIFYYNIKEHRNTKDSYVFYVFLLFLSSILFIKARMMIRIIMLLVPLMAISFPQLVSKENKIKRPTNNKIGYMFLIIISLGYHLFLLLTSWQNVVPYIPFWE